MTSRWMMCVLASISLLSFGCGASEGGGDGGSGATAGDGGSGGEAGGEGQWGDPVLIESDDAGTADAPQVAVDPNGNAVAVWRQSDGTRENIWANRFTPAAGWGVAELIETAEGSASRPQVALDPNGNAVAVWEQSDATRENIWANRLTPAAGWGVAELIETAEGRASRPQVALDPNGNAVAVWMQWDGTHDSIWANRFTPTAGWGAAGLIETAEGFAQQPQVALDPNGNAVAVWMQNGNLWANRFTPAAGWSAAELIETGAYTPALPQVAVDPNGNAVAVWRQSDGTHLRIWANRFTPAAGWGVAELIETAAGSTTAPQVALDPNGNAVAVWQQLDGMRSDIWANRFTLAAGWGVAELIETDNAGGANAPQVAVDTNGNAMAVWSQSDAMQFSIWANRFAPAAGWGVAELIETDNTGDAIAPQVAVDANGNAVAVWDQSDGMHSNIWANRFE